MQYTKKLKLSVSIVIPAYNEEHSLKRCLDAIERQAIKPLEVIVVDNNSSDQTAAIARAYPFVKVITERRQGVVFARDRGFDAAKGDIIGRIDVDTVLPPNWVRKVAEIFENDAIDAASGVIHYYDIALPHVVDAIDLYFRRRMATVLQEEEAVFMQGANMAIRKTAWQHVRRVLCRRGNMHEDFDLAIHLQEYGHTVVFEERLHASTSARRADTNFLSFARYARMSPHTYALHQIDGGRQMYKVVAWALIGYLPARILHRGYNPLTGRFSLQRVFSPQATSGRADPTYLP